MGNPSENLGEDCSKLSESHGGRPPDTSLTPSESLFSLNEIPVLERHGSPIPTEIMPMAKRGCIETDSATTGTRVTNNRGSRFTILQDPKEVELEIEQVADHTVPHAPIEHQPGPLTSMPRGKDPIETTRNGAGCSKSTDQHDDIENSYRLREMSMEQDDGIHRLIGKEVIDLEMGLVKEVASNDSIKVSETTLNKVNHTMVRIGDNNTTQNTKERSGRILPASIQGGSSKNQVKTVIALKGGQKLGTKVKKKDELGLAKPALEARILALTSELDKAEAAEIERRKGNQGDDIHWRENGMFNQPRDNLG
ncbi:hypothetical protein V6N11_055361 [Hibiscus sabdariffa]|uniref:Uncharacterized protein n=1 Tax=Hibiscus sabdariffa TaxID=183260 RepID=A0ABR2PF39_9ROSI